MDSLGTTSVRYALYFGQPACIYPQFMDEQSSVSTENALASAAGCTQKQAEIIDFPGNQPIDRSGRGYLGQSNVLPFFLPPTASNTPGSHSRNNSRGTYFGPQIIEDTIFEEDFFIPAPVTGKYNNALAATTDLIQAMYENPHVYNILSGALFLHDPEMGQNFESNIVRMAEAVFEHTGSEVRAPLDDEAKVLLAKQWMRLAHQSAAILTAKDLACGNLTGVHILYDHHTLKNVTTESEADEILEFLAARAHAHLEKKKGVSKRSTTKSHVPGIRDKLRALLLLFLNKD